MKEYIEIPVVCENSTQLPHYGSDEAAGADVRAHLNMPMSIPPGKSALVPTGLKFQIPQGFEIQVRPRSGLALNHLITVLNTPGTIDSDYRGEIKVILMNHGSEEFIVEPGMRIAQIVLAPVLRARFFKVEELESSLRGVGGFGHTGTH